MKAEVHFEDGDILPITLPCGDSFEAMNLLRDLIERDKPKKQYFDGLNLVCPVCNSRLDFEGLYGREFCHMCGQRLE